jgi:hypothetical protein
MSDVIKFKDKDGKVVFTLKEEDTEPKATEEIKEVVGKLEACLAPCCAGVPCGSEKEEKDVDNA